MKVVILAGGRGTRLAEETHLIPKPMVDIGGRPLLWHIMKYYEKFGLNDFIICLGYKKEVIIDFFANYKDRNSDLRINMETGKTERLAYHAEHWTITLVDTGLDTMTAGRVRKILPYTDGEPFCLTYGDGLTDADIGAEIAFHRDHDLVGTVLAVRPSPRFGALDIADCGTVRTFSEKPVSETGLINGGFFILEPGIEAYLQVPDSMPFESEPLKRLAADGQLRAFEHRGFWQPCDTMRDRQVLEELWDRGDAPWKWY